jgi:hypothetical protein
MFAVIILLSQKQLILSCTGGWETPLINSAEKLNSLGGEK